jgi:hypothetical protein
MILAYYGVAIVVYSDNLNAPKWCTSSMTYIEGKIMDTDVKFTKSVMTSTLRELLAIAVEAKKLKAKARVSKSNEQAWLRAGFGKLDKNPETVSALLIEYWEKAIEEVEVDGETVRARTEAQIRSAFATASKFVLNQGYAVKNGKLVKVRERDSSKDALQRVFKQINFNDYTAKQKTELARIIAEYHNSIQK